MSYVYIRSEPQLWTVGFYRPDGKWEPESDQGSPEEAAKRVAWLNGGGAPWGACIVCGTPWPRQDADVCATCGTLAGAREDEPEPGPEEYDPGPEADDEGGMSEYRYILPEDYGRGQS